MKITQAMIGRESNPIESNDFVKKIVVNIERRMKSFGDPYEKAKSLSLLGFNYDDELSELIDEQFSKRKTNPTGEIVSIYKTPTGENAMTIRSNDDVNFSYSGKYGAGSGAKYPTMKKEVLMMLKYHPRVKLTEGEDFLTLGDPVGKRKTNPMTKNNLPDYRKKSDEELRYIISDAGEAARAMKGHSPAAELKYLDQINDASTVLYERAAKFRGRKTNPVKGEKTFKAGDYVITDRGEIGRVSFSRASPAGYADKYRLIDVEANDPHSQTFLENGNFINGTRLKAYKSKTRKTNPAVKKAKAPTLQERAKKFSIELGNNKFKTWKKAVGYYPSEYSPDYELVALFQTHKEAVNAGRAFAESHPKYRWFVKDL